MALTQDNWHNSFVTYRLLTVTETDFEAGLLSFAKRHMSPEMALECLGTCIKYPLYKSPFEEV